MLSPFLSSFSSAAEFSQGSSWQRSGIDQFWDGFFSQIL